MEDDAATAWLALEGTPGLGPVTLAEMRRLWGSGPAVLEAGAERWHVEAGMHAQRARASFAHARAARRQARRELRALRSAGYVLLHPDHAEYPPPLMHLPDPPPVLYLAGAVPPPLRAPFEAARAFAVVGTRRASDWGRAFADELGARLAAAGVVVVSGLALGIDAAAHEGTLRAAGAPAVAVLGSGLRRIHPARHLGLARRIVASGGALLSEHPPDAPARPGHFPRRNRIIAGLARGVAVVEAGPRSGAVITANLANDYGRNVYAVPRRPDLEVGRGTLGLLCDGATPLGDAAQILVEFGWQDGDAGPDAGDEAAERGEDDCASVLRALERHGSMSDRRLAQVVPDPSRLLASLTLLELQGRVHRDASGHWHLRAALTPRRQRRAASQR